jgi:hypothetical protein
MVRFAKRGVGRGLLTRSRGVLVDFSLLEVFFLVNVVFCKLPCCIGSVLTRSRGVHLAIVFCKL